MDKTGRDDGTTDMIENGGESHGSKVQVKLSNGDNGFVKKLSLRTYLKEENALVN